MLVYCTLRCQTHSDRASIQQCQRFVRLLHQCRLDCQRGSEDIFVSSGRLISSTDAFSAPVPCGQRRQPRHPHCATAHTLDTHITVTPGHHHATSGTLSGVHALTVAMQSISFISASAGRIPHSGFPVRRNVPSVRSAFFFRLRQHRFRLRQTAVCSASSRHSPTGSMRPVHHPQPRLPEGVQQHPGVFPAGRHRAHAVDIPLPVIAEQISTQFVSEKASAPTKRNLLFPATATSFRSPDDEWSELPVYRPIPTEGGLKHLHLTRGVVLQRQRLKCSVVMRSSASASRMTGARSPVSAFAGHGGVNSPANHRFVRCFAFLRHCAESGNLFSRVLSRR